MGRPDFRQPTAYPTPPISHALHDDDEADVVDGDVAKVVHDGLPAEPKATLPLGYRWRVPLTRVHNSSGALLLYRDQLDAQTVD